MQQPKNDIDEVINQVQTLALQSFNDSEGIKILAAHIDHLVVNDFSRLIYLLYRLDISEEKLKQLLQQHSVSAGTVIAILMVERQLQINESRKHFTSSTSIPEDEKW